MQMSRERFQEVHKLIWNTVISHAQEVRDGKASVYFLKCMGLNKAYDKGLLDLDELNLIKQNNACLLCAACTTCMDCILGNCRNSNSLYSKATTGNVKSMLEIRDVVDTWPFTVFSIINLHEWNTRR